ncbi:hypothetical protein K1719_035148 [Acacia pycnantha]|nr:hypothetical protein K1719_035148 [Acacia pycnantha]
MNICTVLQLVPSLKFNKSGSGHGFRYQASLYMKVSSSTHSPTQSPLNSKKRRVSFVLSPPKIKLNLFLLSPSLTSLSLSPTEVREIK